MDALKMKAGLALALLGCVGWAQIALAGPPAARSGIYENMLVAVSGDKLTGVFADQRAGNGTDDAPQFSCVFTISGTVSGSHAEITTWTPGETATIPGSIDFTDADAALKLKDNQDGCANTSGDMVDEAMTLDRSGEGQGWIGTGLIGAKKAVLGTAPAAPTRTKPYLVQYDPVALLDRQGDWVKIAYVAGEQPITGWVKATDLILGPPAGLAEAAPPTASDAAADTPQGKSVVATASGDLDGDGIADKVQLLEADGDSDVDLSLALSKSPGAGGKPTLYLPAFGWEAEGETPQASITARGALVLDFNNDQGRDRWHKRLTILVRNGAAVVAGYTYEAHDALSTAKGDSCDLNLLTGTGTRNGAPARVAKGGVPLADWTDDSVPQPCQFDD